MERERLRREVELQRQRLQELVQQQMQARPAWQTMLLPALGAGFFALLLGRQEYFASDLALHPGRLSICSASWADPVPSIFSTWLFLDVHQSWAGVLNALEALTAEWSSARLRVQVCCLEYMTLSRTCSRVGKHAN